MALKRITLGFRAHTSGSKASGCNEKIAIFNRTDSFEWRRSVRSMMFYISHSSLLPFFTSPPPSELFKVLGFQMSERSLTLQSFRTSWNLQRNVWRPQKHCSCSNDIISVLNDCASWPHSWSLLIHLRCSHQTSLAHTCLMNRCLAEELNYLTFVPRKGINRLSCIICYISLIIYHLKSLFRKF